MDYAEYQEISEDEARKERNQYENLSVLELVELVQKRWFGEYGQIWYVLEKRASIGDVLER